MLYRQEETFEARFETLRRDYAAANAGRGYARTTPLRSLFRKITAR
jgi:hypothetical protein